MWFNENTVHLNFFEQLDLAIQFKELGACYQLLHVSALATELKFISRWLTNCIKNLDKRTWSLIVRCFGSRGQNKFE